MKNSNSRDKNANTKAMDSNNRLMRTANHTKKQQIEKTSYNRPSSGKNLPPPRNQPVQKKQYIIEDNMTVSRITEAKQGLQLLKKKMTAKGMSRQKNKAPEPKMQKPSLKTISSNNLQDYNENSNTRSNMPPKNVQKKYSEPEQTSTYSKPEQTSTYSKPTAYKKSEPQREAYQPANQYGDPEMEAPIKPKKDFNALLEEELRKEAGNNKPAKQQQPSQYPDEYEDVGELIQCGQGCGRMFNSKAIEKHEKICQKVFQSKRKAFDSAANRAPEVEGFNKPPQISSKKQGKQPPAKKLPEKEGKMPKWKAQSLALRAGLKCGKGEQLTKEQKQAVDGGPDGDNVQCKFCGRKFNATAGARHIAFCETKSKQVPSNNNNKKKK